MAKDRWPGDRRPELLRGAVHIFAPEPRLRACRACRYLVETVDSHGMCDECAAAADAAELNAWCDALREAAIAHPLAAEAEISANSAAPAPERSVM